MLKFKKKGGGYGYLVEATQEPKKRRDYRFLDHGKSYTMEIRHAADTESWEILVVTHPKQKSSTLYVKETKQQIGVVPSLERITILRAARTVGTIHRNMQKLVKLFTHLNEAFVLKFDPELLDSSGEE